MPGKAVSKEKKAVARKTVTPAKKTSRATASKSTKGDNFVCGTCGLSMIVDEWGDIYAEELICCGKPMKQKARKAKAAAK